MRKFKGWQMSPIIEKALCDSGKKEIVKEVLAAIQQELGRIKRERECSEHNGGQHYNRGFRDGLKWVREELQSKLEDSSDAQAVG
jgi:hypothetical protein